MKAYSLFVSIVCFIFLFSFPQKISAQQKTYPLRVAVLEALSLNQSKSTKEQNRSRVFRYSLSEVLSQDIQKIPEVIVLDLETVRKELSVRKLEEVPADFFVAQGLDYLIQVEYLFLDKKKIELRLVALDSSSGKRHVVRKLQGPESKVLEMLDDFTLVLAKQFNREIDSKREKWIKSQKNLSLKAWSRYGRGLDFYYKQTQGGMILAQEQFRKAEFFDVLFLPPYVARAKAELFLYKSNPKNKKYLDGAYESLRKALFTDSKYLEAYELLSVVYFEKGNYADSVREGLRALRLKPLSLPARLSVAEAYIAMNKKAEAERELNKILEVDPTNKEARRLLSQ